MSDRAHCPICGIPTVSDREGLTDEEAMCERCHARIERETQRGRYIDCGPQAWDDIGPSPDY